MPQDWTKQFEWEEPATPTTDWESQFEWDEPEQPATPERSFDRLGYEELRQIADFGRATGDYNMAKLADEQIESQFGSHSKPETLIGKTSRIGQGFLGSVGEMFTHPDEEAGGIAKGVYFFTTPGREFAATNINILNGWSNTLSMGASGALERFEQTVIDSEYQLALNEAHVEMYGVERPEEFARKLNESLRAANVPLGERQRMVEEQTEEYLENNPEIFKADDYDPTAGISPPNLAFERIAAREASEYSDLGLTDKALKFTQEHFRSWAEYQLPEDHWAWRDNVIQRDFAQGLGSYMAFATAFALGPAGPAGSAIMAGGMGAYDFQQDAEQSFREMNDGADLEDWQRDIIARSAPNTGIALGVAQMTPIAVMYARLRQPMQKLTGSNKLWREVTEASFIGVQEATLEGFYEWAKNDTARRFEYDPDRTHWENVAHASALGGSVGFVGTLLMRGMLGGRGPMAAVRRSYENEAVKNDKQVAEARARENKLFEAYESAQGLGGKAKAYKEFRTAQREREKLETDARKKARAELDGKFVTPENDGTLEKHGTPVRDPDVTLDDVQRAQGVESEVDLVGGEADQTTPDFSTAKFTPIEETRNAEPQPAATADQTTFRPFVNEQADPAADTVFSETRRAEIDGRAASFGFVFPGNLKVDAATYQFKRTDDPEGRTDRFTGDEAWSPTSAGTIIVHRRPDGDYVADGHQRSALARSRQEAGDDPSSLYSQALILNESDGWTARDVRLLAALKNVRGETGTAVDAATLIREGGEAVLEAMADTINPRRAIWRDALGLAGLSDTVFQQVAAGDLSVDRGAIIGRHISDPGKQLAALEYMRDNPPANQYEAEMIARDINRMEAMESDQGGFDFGDAIAQVPIKERAKILDAARKDLNTRKKVFKQLVRDQALIEGEASNVLDAEGNVQIAQTAETVMEILNRLVDTNPQINEVLNNAAAELAAGNTTARAAARELINRATEVAQSVLGGREAGQGDQQAAQPVQPGQRPESPVSEPVRPEAGEGAQGPVDAQARPEAQETTEQAPEAADAAQPVTQEQTDARPDTTTRPERPERPARAEPEPGDQQATGRMGDGSPDTAGVRPPLRVASEERIPRPRIHVNPDSYQAGLDEHQQLAVNLVIDRFESGGLGFMLADGTGTGKTRQILAVADQFQQRTGKPVLIVTKSEPIIKRQFAPDAQAMGLDLGNFEITTYSGVRTKKAGQSEYGLVIFDEAHSLKNSTAAKTIAANNIQTEHKLFATATPMDSVAGAVYFMTEITGMSEAQIYEQIGLTVIETFNEQTQQTETHVQLTKGFKWQDVIDNLVGLRNQAVEQGAMVRREYPFFGEMTAETVKLAELQTHTESKIDDYWQAQIEEAKGPRAKRNRAGQRIGELSRWLESQKVSAAFDMIKRKIAEGRSIIIVAEGVNPTTIKALNKEVQGALGALAARLNEAGIPFAQIYGSGDKAGAIEQFQSGQVAVALTTPKSGAEGISLDDVVGNRPRTLVTLTDNFAGDIFEQILGRVSRRNTASPAEVISLTSDGLSDVRRREILNRKMQTLKAIQTGEDLDAAHLQQEGPEDIRLSVGGAEGQRIGINEAQEFLEQQIRPLAVRPETVQAVQHESDLPAGIQLEILSKNAQGRTRGAIHQGQIYLVMDNIGSRADMERVLWHELKGHYGLRQLLGDDLNPVLDRVWTSYGEAKLAPWIRAYFGNRFDRNNPEHRREVAEEKLASLAETNPQSNLVKRAIGVIRDWLRRHGFMTLAKLTESDLVHLMAKTGDFVDGATRASDANALPAWARDNTVTGNRPTWGEFLDHLSGWRVQQIRDMLKEINPELQVETMDRAALESAVRGFTGFAGVSDALIPLNAWEALEGHDIRFSKLDQNELFDDAPTDQQQATEQRRRQVDERLRGREDVPVEEGPGDLFGESTDRKQGTLLSLVPEDPAVPVPKQNLLNKAIVGALQFGRIPAGAFDAANMTIDTVLRTPFAVIGGLDRAGRWKPGVALYDGISNVVTEWKPQGESAPIQFVGYTMDYLRAGFVDRWGHTDTQRRFSREAGRDRDAILSFMGRILQNLNQQGLSASDYVTLTNILEGKQVSDKRLKELAEPIRNTIDDLGMELVRLGFLTAETWQKGVGKYLHRSYKKYEQELQGIKGIPFIGDKIVRRSFNKRIKGDEFRARGMKQEVSQARLQRNLPPDWWKRKIKPGEADKSLKNTKWIILDHIEAFGEGSDPLIGEDAQAATRARRDRVFWPADEPIPSNYAGWESQGEFEVLSITGDKITLRRDYTDAEMETMGRVMDARFNIIRTFQLMAHDISTGRFFEDIAKSELSIKMSERGKDEIVVSGNRATHASLITADWVQVPNDKIYPGAKVDRFGAIAGRLVRPEVWREIASMDKAANPGTWMKLLRHWKANKALALDTPIPTVDGWTTMGEVRVGQTVFDENGQPCQVLEVNDIVEGRPCYRVEFSDGSHIVCDEEHLWYTQRGVEKEGCGKVRTTAEIKDTLREQTRGDARHKIPVAGPLSTPERKLALDPYLLGVWLGDGHCGKPVFTTSEADCDDLLMLMASRGAYFGTPIRDKRSTAVNYSFDIQPVAAGRAPNLVKEALSQLGVLTDKFIPASYLRCSESQRMELLRGLIDTDGWVTTRGECGYATSSWRLRDGVFELIASLGYKPRVSEFLSQSGKPAWRILFKPYADRPPCCLGRKVTRLKPAPKRRQRSGTRQIVNVTPVDSVPVRCIMVSSDSHLYLAGESMVPTHNTIRNPVVHMNNVMSNVGLMDLQDVRMSDLVSAMIEFVQGGPMHQMAAQDGGYGGIYVNNELNRRVLKPIMDEIVRDMKTHGEDSPQAMARVWSEIKLKVAQSAELLKAADQKLFKAYEMEDVVFRLATYTKYRNLGFSGAEAADIAVDAFLNYDIQAPAVNWLRNNALPFLAYSYRAGPVIAAALAHRPWKMAKYILLGYLWNQFAYWWDDDANEDLERASIRPQAQGMTWMSIPGTDIGVHRMVKMPFRDAHGQALYLDVLRWIPFGDVYDTNQTISGLPAWLQVSGPITSGYEMLANRSMFTGEDIYDRQLAGPMGEGGALANLARGNVTEKMGAMLDFAWKSYAPGAAFVPGTWHYEKITAARRGGEDRLGRAYSMNTALASAVGVKLQPVDTDLATRYQSNEIRRFKGAIERHLRDAADRYDRNLISEAEYNRRVEEYNRRLRLLERRVEEFQEPRR